MVSAIEPLLICSQQAAAMLAVSARTLWTLANRGEIPRVKIGHVVRYDVADLKAWISNQKAASMVVA